MRYIKIFEEFNYDQHKQEGIQIIDRFKLSINPGSNDVIEVEGLLARDNNDSLLFKPTSESKVFLSSNSRQLIKDEEISLMRSEKHTQTTVNLLNNNINKWLPIKTDYDNLISDINVGEIIDVSTYGTSFIGNLDGIFNTIKFEKI
jgi:hypothetical protein